MAYGTQMANGFADSRHPTERGDWVIKEKKNLDPKAVHRICECGTAYKILRLIVDFSDQTRR